MSCYPKHRGRVGYGAEGISAHPCTVEGNCHLLCSVTTWCQHALWCSSFWSSSRGRMWPLPTCPPFCCCCYCMGETPRSSGPILTDLPSLPTLLSEMGLSGSAQGEEEDMEV